jgi:hypothetical protein
VLIFHDSRDLIIDRILKANKRPVLRVIGNIKLLSDFFYSLVNVGIALFEQRYTLINGADKPGTVNNSCERCDHRTNERDVVSHWRLVFISEFKNKKARTVSRSGFLKMGMYKIPSVSMIPYIGAALSIACAKYNCALACRGVQLTKALPFAHVL